MSYKGDAIMKLSEQPEKILANHLDKEHPSIGLYLLDRLHALGVHHIFGVPGDYVLRLDKLIEQHPIKFINTTRENTAGYMADAYSRMRGLGAVCITYGVSINIANALTQAYVESSPLVVISGAPGVDEVRTTSKLHHLFNKATIGRLDPTQLEIFKHITIDQVVLDDPNTAAELIDRALNAAIRYQKPVYIEVPRNRVDQPLKQIKPIAFPQPTSDPVILQEALKEAATILQKCQRPILWMGHEIQRFGLIEPLLNFAEKYHIPMTSTLLGKTVIDEQHPLFIGVYMGGMSRPEVIRYVENCDCILNLGLIMTDVDTGIFSARADYPYQISANSEKVAVGHHTYDILFQDFIKGIASTSLSGPFSNNIPACVESKPALFEAKKNHKTTTQKLFECLQSFIKPEHLVVTDVGDCLFGAADLILSQHSFLASAYFATLGFGTPGAVGAQIAVPRRRVIGIVGDGAFQMTGTELSTAVRYHLDPIIIVLNNHGYATERPLLEGGYNDIQNWNYAALTQMVGGGVGLKATTEEEMEAAFKEAFSNRGRLYLIEIDLDKTDFSPALRRFAKLQKT